MLVLHTEAWKRIFFSVRSETIPPTCYKTESLELFPQLTEKYKLNKNYSPKYTCELAATTYSTKNGQFSLLGIQIVDLLGQSQVPLAISLITEHGSIMDCVRA